jgi:hypothetical protein
LTLVIPFSIATDSEYEHVQVFGLRFQLLPLYARYLPTALVIDLGSQICLLILGDLELVSKTLDFDLEVFGAGYFLTSIGGEIVLVMWLRAVDHTETPEKILNWLAGYAAANL